METLTAIWTNLSQVWTTGVIGTDLGAIILGLAILLFFIVTRALIPTFIIKRLANRTRTKIDDMFVEALAQPLRFAFIVLGFSIAVHISGIYDQTQVWMGTLIRSLIATSIFWVVYNLVEPLSHLINHLLSRLNTSITTQETLREFFVRVLKVTIFALGVAAVLQEWGFNVAAILGGLGLMGMAVALAAKDVVSNLFAGITIFINRAFEIGDWIKTPRLEGVVEHLGLMTTKVRRFDKALVIVDNRSLTSEPIINFSRMTNRRIYWHIGLEYGTTENQLRTIVNQIGKYIHQNEAFETDPKKVSTFVVVDAFADSSVNLMLYCFTKTTNWGEWLSIKQDLALEIKDIVEKNEAGFAFPSTSLYVERMPFGKPESFPIERQKK